MNSTPLGESLPCSVHPRRRPLLSPGPLVLNPQQLLSRLLLFPKRFDPQNTNFSSILSCAHLVLRSQTSGSSHLLPGGTSGDLGSQAALGALPWDNFSAETLGNDVTIRQAGCHLASSSSSSGNAVVPGVLGVRVTHGQYSAYTKSGTIVSQLSFWGNRVWTKKTKETRRIATTKRIFY